MKDIQQIHMNAMELARQANQAQLDGDHSLFRQSMERAYLLEKEAAEELISLTGSEPTRGVLFRSAATLAVNIGKFREAAELIQSALSGNPFPEIRSELEALQVKVRASLEDGSYRQRWDSGKDYLSIASEPEAPYTLNEPEAIYEARPKRYTQFKSFMKSRIFIGSSSEGLATARLVKEMLSDVADCQIWNEGFFKMNRSSFESLSEGAILFDFSILVATADDIQLKRDDLQSIARDNVIFEFGLYVGRLGRDRAFLLKEKGLGLPSDVFGITLPEFDNSKGDGHGSLQVAVDGIRSHILEQSKLYQLSFIPSTAIAIGYFENFVLKVCRELLNAPKRFANGRDHTSFILHVVLPDELPDDFNDQVIAYLSSKGLKQMEVDTTTRKYNFYLSYSKEDSDVLKVYDIPTTLSAIKRSIEMAIPKDYVGESDWERVLKQKEMHNFCQTLKYLISKNPVTKDKVEIVFIDING